MSAYLRRVKAGETVLVTERRTPIARIVPVGLDAEGGVKADSVDKDAKLARLEQAGIVVRRSAGNPLDVLGQPLRSGAGVLEALLDERLEESREGDRVNFWDTSALVALGVAEPHRRNRVCILEADDRMAVWWGAPVEYVAAFRGGNVMEA